MPVALETAEGSISLAEQHVANMLAGSETVRTRWFGADDEAEAKQKIFFDALPPAASGKAAYTRDELQKLRPFAIVFTAEQNGFRRTRIATETYAESGAIGLTVERDVRPEEENNPARLMRNFRNELGVIINELTELGYQADYLAFDVIELVGHARIHEDEVPEQGDHVFAFLLLTWGVTG